MGVQTDLSMLFSVSLDFDSSFFAGSGNTNGLFLDLWNDSTNKNQILKLSLTTGSVAWNYELVADYQPSYIMFNAGFDGISLGMHKSDPSKFDIKYFELLSTCSYCLSDTF